MASYLEQTEAAGREVFPDLVRAFALIGIALVNVGLFAYPMMAGPYDAGFLSGADKAAYFTSNGFFLLKSYTLFSFMFGVGFAYQMVSAEKRGVGFSGRYWRRILGLLAFGLINIAFLFQGDILVMYALLGSILFLFRNASWKTLRNWGVGIYVVQTLIVALMALGFYMASTYAPEEMAAMNTQNAELIADQRAAFGAGTLADAIAQRFTDWSGVITMGLMFQGWGAMAFFLLGFAAVRNGLISNPSAPFWSRCRRVFLPIGIVISLAGAWLAYQSDSMMSPTGMIGMALITLGSPFSSAGYLGLIAKWAARPMDPLKAFLARGGTSSLTAYLLQGLILSLVFNAYGLGLFEKIGYAQAFAIAFVTAIATVVFASLWRIAFPQGPMEAILRRWTYLGAR